MRISPNEDVALNMQMEEIEFLAGTSYNTLLFFSMHKLPYFYIIIPCKALHWSGLDRPLFIKTNSIAVFFLW